MTNLKILMISDDYLPNPGGISGHVYELTRELALAGCSIDLIAGHNRKHAGQDVLPLPENVRVIRNRPFTWSWGGYIGSSLDTRQHIKRLCAENQYDIIHWHNLVWETLGVKSSFQNVPRVFTNHSSGFLRRMKQPLRKAIQMPFLLNTADWIITPSEELKEKSIEGGFAEEKITFVPNGVNVELFTPGDRDRALMEKYGLKDDDDVIVVPRRLDPKNGVDILVHALSTAVESRPNLKLLLVGDGEQRPLLESLIEKYGLHENVIFCGSQPRSLMPAHLRLASLAILPSRAEAVSLAGLEAMSCCLPVIGSNVGGIPEFVKDNETGFLFPTEDHDALSERIVHFFGLDAEEKARIAGNSREFVSGKFSWKSAAQKTISVYENLVREMAK